MCAAKTPFDKLLDFGNGAGQGEIDHTLLSKVVGLHDRVCFFETLESHPDLADWTSDLFDMTKTLAPIFRKPISARIALADGLSVPRARSILPIHPLASAPLPRPPLWMHDLPFGPETGVRAKKVSLQQARQMPMPARDLMSATGHLGKERLLEMADRNFLDVGHAMMLGRGRPCGGNADEEWRFWMHSGQLRIFGPIDLTGSEVGARTCAYAGRALQHVADITLDAGLPTPFALSGTICGERVLGATLAIPLKNAEPGSVEVVILTHDLHCPVN